MTHCERCGHGVSSHNDLGECSHAVGYGTGFCSCDNYLRAVAPLADMLATALHTGPGRDANGSFYSSAQARLVGRYAEALLDEVAPTGSINAIELLEGWRDRQTPAERRWYQLHAQQDGGFWCALYVTLHNGTKSFCWTSTQNARDAAAKAIMKASQDGHE